MRATSRALFADWRGAERRRDRLREQHRRDDSQ